LICPWFALDLPLQENGSRVHRQCNAVDLPLICPWFALDLPQNIFFAKIIYLFVDTMYIM
jgi:hypothetical protein